MLIALYLSLALLALLVIYLWNRERLIHQKYGHIPGPKGLPLLGNAHQIDRLKPWITFSEWAKTYGPVMKVNIMGHVIVICNTYESVKEILETKGKEFGGRERGFRSQMVSGGHGFMRMDSHDDKWRISRRLLHSSIKAFGPGISRIEHYAQQMSEEFIQSFKSTEGQPIDPLPTIFDTTLGMITLMIFGQKLNQSSDIFHQIKTMTNLTNESFHVGKDGAMLDHFPWLRYFGNNTYDILKEVKKCYDNVWSWYVNEVATLDGSDLDDTLGKPYLKVIREHNSKCKEDERIDEADMRGNAAQVTFAGVLSTATTLYETILMLLRHPDVKERMCKEIEDVIGDRTASLNDRNRMPYVNAVLNEVLRYCSSGPLGIAHRSVCDSDILGIPIKKDTFVMANIYLVQYDRKVFPDADTFRPERYLDSKGEMLPADHPVNRQTIPFGLGPRVCAGMLFAQFRLFLWTVTLYQRFNILKDPENPLPSTRVQDFHLNGISLMPDSFRVRFMAKEEGDAAA